MRFFWLILALPIAPPALADGFGFRTPSGNIYCNGAIEGGATMTCTIVNRDAGSSPPAIGTCPAGRVFQVSLGERGPAEGRCGGRAGNLSTYTDIADYGVTGRFGRIVCQSARSGLSCRNADGRGFSLSRQSQQLF